MGALLFAVFERRGFRLVLWVEIKKGGLPTAEPAWLLGYPCSLVLEQVLQCQLQVSGTIYVADVSSAPHLDTSCEGQSNQKARESKRIKVLMQCDSRI